MTNKTKVTPINEYIAREMPVKAETYDKSEWCEWVFGSVIEALGISLKDISIQHLNDAKRTMRLFTTDSYDMHQNRPLEAAAPAMLEALKAVAYFADQYPWTGLGDAHGYNDGGVGLLRKLNEAIALAEKNGGAGGPGNSP